MKYASPFSRLTGNQRIAGCLIVLTCLTGTAVAQTRACSRTLSIELTPDVPDEADAGFLSSLVGDNPGYSLLLIRERRGSVIVVTLTGPGPQSACDKVVEAINHDGRVLTVEVAPAT